MTLWKNLLDIANAGKDDGFPTSVLRELSHLQSLRHPNIVKIEFVEVWQKVVQIVYENCDLNLKEFKEFYKQ